MKVRVTKKLSDAPVTVPILSLAGGIAGSFAGDALAKWVVDITYVGE